MNINYLDHLIFYAASAISIVIESARVKYGLLCFSSMFTISSGPQ